MKMNMDNFNGQNQMGSNLNMQGQYMQNPYPQYQQIPENMYQQAPQNMYQQAPQNTQESQMYMQQSQQYMQNIPQPQQYAQNGNFEQIEQPKPKKKRKWLKWSLIIGIPLVVIVATILIIKMILGPSYNIDDFDNVKKACRKVFDLEFETLDRDISDRLIGMIVKKRGYGRGPSDCYSVEVEWCEFENDKRAREYYEDHVEHEREEYNLEKEYLEEHSEEVDMDCAFKSNETITERCIIRPDYARKVIWITKGNCVLELNIKGDDIESLHDLTKKFYNKLD